MKKYLLPEEGNFYKANLHCHSTVSDGHLTPEELKAFYQAHGYSILCYTDHEVFIPHHKQLSDATFLALNGMELSANQIHADPGRAVKVCHLCYIAKDPDNEIHPLWHRSKYLYNNERNYHDQVKFEPAVPDFEREYTPSCVNKMIRIGKEAGFFVTYNHPTWSLESYPEYSRYEGMDAMEMVNYSCIAEGFDEYNARVYDDMLCLGKRLYCIATDDNHNGTVPDSFGGFTMIKAPALTYPDVIRALENGDFYASEGPQILSLVYDSDAQNITIRAKGEVRMFATSAVRHRKVVHGAPGATETVGTFPLRGDEGYIRFTVTDAAGKHADTNAYFLSDFYIPTQA